MELLDRTQKLREQVNSISFTFDGYIYNPLDYAWNSHCEYLKKINTNPKAFFLGMNPGPLGMMQTGIPFGEVNFVKNWMKIEAVVEKPKREHPNRPVLGFNCPRSEISGKRFWGLFSQRYPNSDDFFKSNCVFNYCPLGFLDAGKTAKNITPDKLNKIERLELERICDLYLYDVLEFLKPQVLIGVGKYAQAKLNAVNKDKNRLVISIIHPSPGNPQANKNWDEKTIKTLQDVGVWEC